jgi:hypothetical protein
MVSEEFERLVEQPCFGLIGQPFAQFWLDSEKREEWHDRIARPPRAWEFVSRFRCSRSACSGRNQPDVNFGPAA